MKVLFVSSGNSKNFEIAPFIKAQGEDLRKLGVKVDFFLIKGKGIRGYIKNIPILRKHIKKNNYDLIHAHYVFSAWVALLTFTRKKIITSFMGSDTYGDVDLYGKRKKISYFTIIIAKLIQPFLSKIIVKSKNLEEYIYLKSKCIILQNGVNLEKFYTLNYNETRKELGLDENKKYILFLGNKNDPRKNYKLLLDAFQEIKDNSIEILAPYPIPHELVVKYLNAVDVLAFTSFLEGSPNVLKEAMACNLSIVTVNVGDSISVTEGVNGCYLASYKVVDFACQLNRAVKFGLKTQGRNKILDMKLDSKSVAIKLLETYKSIL